MELEPDAVAGVHVTAVDPGGLAGPGAGQGRREAFAVAAEARQDGGEAVGDRRQRAIDDRELVQYAVVTETGGVLSHAAIVARERGIPAVVGVPGAMTRLRDGEYVTVDGSAGVVRP